MTDADPAAALPPPAPPPSGFRVLRWSLWGCGVVLIAGSLGAAYWGFVAMEEVRNVSREAVEEANAYVLGSSYLAGELGTLKSAGPASSEPVAFRPGARIDVSMRVEGALGSGVGVVWIRREGKTYTVTGCEIVAGDGRKLRLGKP